MSFGPGMNAAGGLWMGPDMSSALDSGNGNQPFLPTLVCDAGTGGNGSGGNGGSCGCGDSGSIANASRGPRAGGSGQVNDYWRGVFFADAGGSCGPGTGGNGSSGGPILSTIGPVGTFSLDAPLPIAPLCTPPAGGPTPSSVFSSGSLLVQVQVVDQSAQPVKGLLMQCAETGASYASICGYVNFFVPSFQTYHFSTPGGSGTQCLGGQSFTYPSASKSGNPMSQVQILSNHL